MVGTKNPGPFCREVVVSGGLTVRICFGFAFAELHNWFQPIRANTVFTQPIKNKTKTNRDLGNARFPALGTVGCFPALGTRCDWLVLVWRQSIENRFQSEDKINILKLASSLQFSIHYYSYTLVYSWLEWRLSSPIDWFTAFMQRFS